MRIGSSRADRIGFVVFTVLAALLAVLLITSLDNDTETAQEVSTFADLPPAPTAVPTTAPLTVPDPTPTPTPFPTTAPTATATPDAEDDSSSTDGSTVDDSSESDAAPVAGDESAAAPAPAPAAGSDTPNPQPQATAVPNPQPQATAVPNPQPQASATAVPNPQPKSTTVPNPQPKATTVPNPQAGSTAPITAPAAAPRGGTFTHTLTAVVSRPTLHSSPGGPVFTPTFRGTALPAVNPTVFGNPLVYRVLAGSPDDTSGWAQVLVPAGGNNSTAWVQTSQFRWGSSNRLIQINVSTNTVTVFEGSNVLLTTGAVTGKSSSRTPLASGWVEEAIDGGRLGSAYGPLALSLGLFSNDLSSFGGSVPKIALHGTNNPGLIGQYASNGCIRVHSNVIGQIRGLVPIGSKVEIVA